MHKGEHVSPSSRPSPHQNAYIIKGNACIEGSACFEGKCNVFIEGN